MFQQLWEGGGDKGGLETLRVNKAVAHLTMNGAIIKQQISKIKLFLFGNILSISSKNLR